jgi:hypothetical protein
MNQPRILYLAHVLENGLAAKIGLGFNMADFWEPHAHDRHLSDKTGHNCGTVACIAGHAVFLAGKATVGKLRGELGVPDEAAKWLGLDAGVFKEANQLFYGWNQTGTGIYSVKMEKVTPADAAKVLRNLVETGEVNWSITKKGENR